MSMNGSGQFASYTPPTPSLEPPGRRPKSPWLYVSLGCGFLVLLAFGGCVGAGVMLSNKVNQEMKLPVTEAQVTHDLGDMPRYPGAKLDTQTTHSGADGNDVLTHDCRCEGRRRRAGFTRPPTRS